MVQGVPAGLVQQLALVPGGRPNCGCCAACEAAAGVHGGGGRGCQVLAALKCWDALLPGLSLSELQQLRQSQHRCGRCRACMRDAQGGGGGGRKRGGGGGSAACLALSWVRVKAGQVQQKLEQLQQERL